MTASLFRRRRDPATQEDVLETVVRGVALTDNPLLNKGTAFTEAERHELGLLGLLPPQVQTIEEQERRVMANFAEKPNDLERYVQLLALLDRNETLFYRIVLNRIEEVLPIIYTPTVGQACQSFSRIYRRRRGLYLTLDDVNRVDEILANWQSSDVGIVVVTDGERILGLGDLGAGGMGISIGKVSLYVTGAGFHPARTLPVCLDVGTNNAGLRADPMYLGQQRARARGSEYDALIEAFINGVSRRFPRAIIQFEDFGKSNAFRLLERYKDRARCFNDDIQGTGAVTCAGVLSALRIAGEPLPRQRVFIAGGGSAGVGIARMLEGAEIWMFDSKGLVTTERAALADEQRPFARAETGGSLLDVARRVHPSILIGVSGQPGLFGREVIEQMNAARPIVFPLSNPTSSSECIPGEVREWTQGRALLAAGSPFPGTAQCNNLYIFPGVGLGVIASGARRVTNAMFMVAAKTLSSMAPAGALYPPLREIRTISREIAVAVGHAAIEAGLAEPVSDDVLRARIAEEVWEPRYVRYRTAT
jgi:malic enzyme